LLNRCWNSIKERGKSVMTVAQAWYVPDTLHISHRPSPLEHFGLPDAKG
jgi:hypothetical protein